MLGNMLARNLSLSVPTFSFRFWFTDGLFKNIVPHSMVGSIHRIGWSARHVDTGSQAMHGQQASWVRRMADHRQGHDEVICASRPNAIRDGKYDAESTGLGWKTEGILDATKNPPPFDLPYTAAVMAISRRIGILIAH